MTDQPLSPASQAVLDALGPSPQIELVTRGIAAAALRAAVEQVLPEELHVPDTPDYPDDVTIKPFYSWLQRCNTRSELLAIAQELENQP